MLGVQVEAAPGGPPKLAFVSVAGEASRAPNL
jgi:hypothetical protein